MLRLPLLLRSASGIQKCLWRSSRSQLHPPFRAFQKLFCCYRCCSVPSPCANVYKQFLQLLQKILRANLDFNPNRRQINTKSHILKITLPSFIQIHVSCEQKTQIVSRAPRPAAYLTLAMFSAIHCHCSYASHAWPEITDYATKRAWYSAIWCSVKACISSCFCHARNHSATQRRA